MSTPIPGFVYSADLIRQAAATEKWVEKEWKRTQRANWGWRAATALAVLLIFLLAGALNYAVPGIRLVPMFFWQKPDGVIETALSTDSLPADMSDLNIQAWLWQYIQHREAYSWTEADNDHHIVSAMSSVPVREVYDAWYSGKNPESYLAKVGRNGVIRVAMREITQYTRAENGGYGKMTVHFDRQVSLSGQTYPVETWAVTVEYLQNYSSGFTWQDIRTFNPSRIVITEYPPARLLPAKGSSIQGVNP